MAVETLLAVDERERLVAQFAEIAALAGGLAHEIKNPLSTISLNLELLIEEVSEGDSPRDRRMLKKLLSLQQANIPAAGKYDMAKFDAHASDAQKRFDAALQKAREEESQAMAAQQAWNDAQRQAQAQAVSTGTPTGIGSSTTPTGTGTAAPNGTTAVPTSGGMLR